MSSTNRFIWPSNNPAPGDVLKVLTYNNPNGTLEWGTGAGETSYIQLERQTGQQSLDLSIQTAIEFTGAVVQKDITYSAPSQFELTTGKTYRLTFSPYITNIGPNDFCSFGLFKGTDTTPQPNTTNKVIGRALMSQLQYFSTGGIDGSQRMNLNSTPEYPDSGPKLDISVSGNIITFNKQGRYRLTAAWQGNQSTGGATVQWYDESLNVATGRQLKADSVNGPSGYNTGNILTQIFEMAVGDQYSVRRISGNLDPLSINSYIIVEQVGTPPELSQTYEILYSPTLTDNYTISTVAAQGLGNVNIDVGSRLLIQEVTSGGGGGGGSPGGVNSSVQFNTNNTFNGNDTFLWDTTNNRLLAAQQGSSTTPLNIPAINPFILDIRNTTNTDGVGINLQADPAGGSLILFSDTSGAVKTQLFQSGTTFNIQSVQLGSVINIQSQAEIGLSASNLLSLSSNTGDVQIVNSTGTYTWPITAATANQILSAGSSPGTMEWVTIDSVPGGVTGSIQYKGSSNNFEGNDNFFVDFTLPSPRLLLATSTATITPLDLSAAGYPGNNLVLDIRNSSAPGGTTDNSWVNVQNKVQRGTGGYLVTDSDNNIKLKIAHDNRDLLTDFSVIDGIDTKLTITNTEEIELRNGSSDLTTTTNSRITLTPLGITLDTPDEPLAQINLNGETEATNLNVTGNLSANAVSLDNGIVYRNSNGFLDNANGLLFEYQQPFGDGDSKTLRFRENGGLLMQDIKSNDPLIQGQTIIRCDGNILEIRAGAVDDEITINSGGQLNLRGKPISIVSTGDIVGIGGETVLISETSRFDVQAAMYSELELVLDPNTGQFDPIDLGVTNQIPDPRTIGWQFNATNLPGAPGGTGLGWGGFYAGLLTEDQFFAPRCEIGMKLSSPINTFPNPTKGYYMSAGLGSTSVSVNIGESISTTSFSDPTNYDTVVRDFSTQALKITPACSIYQIELNNNFPNADDVYELIRPAIVDITNGNVSSLGDSLIISTPGVYRIEVNFNNSLIPSSIINLYNIAGVYDVTAGNFLPRSPRAYDRPGAGSTLVCILNTSGAANREIQIRRLQGGNFDDPGAVITKNILTITKLF